MPVMPVDLRGRCIFGLAVFLAVASSVAYAATRARVKNTGSYEKNVEIRAGNLANCGQNKHWGTVSIPSGSHVDVPYDGNTVTNVCARYELSNGWTNWYSTSCPGGNNELCEINL
jgi:hypothetical protein